MEGIIRRIKYLGNKYVIDIARYTRREIIYT